MSEFQCKFCAAKIQDWVLTGFSAYILSNKTGIFYRNERDFAEAGEQGNYGIGFSLICSKCYEDKSAERIEQDRLQRVRQSENGAMEKREERRISQEKRVAEQRRSRTEWEEERQRQAELRKRAKATLPEITGAAAVVEPDNREIDNCFLLLGVTPAASKDEIKQAYKDLLVVWDSGRFENNADLQRKAIEKLKEIDDAYEKVIVHMARGSSAPKLAPSKAVPPPEVQISPPVSTHRSTTEKAARPVLAATEVPHPSLSYFNASASTTRTASKPPISINNKSSHYGFGWGNFLMVLGFLQGGLAFVFGFILGCTTDVIPNRGVGLIAGLYGLASGVGLLKRKKFGLFLVYINAVIWIIYGLYLVLQARFEGVVPIVIWGLWANYFWKRQGMFD